MTVGGAGSPVAARAVAERSARLAMQRVISSHAAPWRPLAPGVDHPLKPSGKAASCSAASAVRRSTWALVMVAKPVEA